MNNEYKRLMRKTTTSITACFLLSLSSHLEDASNLLYYTGTPNQCAQMGIHIAHTWRINVLTWAFVLHTRSEPMCTHMGSRITHTHTHSESMCTLAFVLHTHSESMRTQAGQCLPATNMWSDSLRQQAYGEGIGGTPSGDYGSKFTLKKLASLKPSRCKSASVQYVTGRSMLSTRVQVHIVHYGAYYEARKKRLSG